MQLQTNSSLFEFKSKLPSNWKSLFVLPAILCLLQDRSDGWLNNEVQDHFIDSINLHNGFTTNKFLQDPPLYAVNIFGIIQLYKYGE